MLSSLGSFRNKMMMKRKTIEDRVLEFQKDAKSRLEANPVGAFFTGLVVGIALTWFRHLLIPALLLSAIAVLLLWVFGENDDAFAEGQDAVPDSDKGQKTNGSTLTTEGERPGASS
jgi:hypothetical protein